jgi:hypothetical protein
MACAAVSSELAQFDSIVPAIKPHYAFFSPLHREIGALPMT